MSLDIDKLIASVSQIKLKGGIFAKAAAALIVMSICVLGAAILCTNFWISVIAIVSIVLPVFILIWRLLNFADKNPQAAILEGAEFLVHEKIQLAMKDVVSIPQSISTLIEEPFIEADGKRLSDVDIKSETEESNE
jgi:hypothetical protein